MALPIKPKDTQDSCSPISSNCVIWQGPDIPCINLCTGDSVSDVVAKLAERLCTITNQLDISLLDLSCITSECPTVKDFQDLIQLILNKVCELENINPTEVISGACPDNCIVNIASCFQETDYLGNLVTTLTLKDYVIKIGNELCSIITTVNNNSSAIASLDARVTFIENNCCDSTPEPINITTNGCIGNNTTKTIQTFVTQLETAYCGLQTIMAGANYLSAQRALSNLCIDGTENQLNQLPATVPLSSITNWVAPVGNISDALNNLYLAFCDLRSYAESRITQLENDLAACCAPSCNDFVINVIGTGVRTQKFIDLYFTGVVPSGFSYCGGATGVTISVTNYDSPAVTSTFINQDVLSAITTGAPISLDLSSVPVSEEGIEYIVSFNVCITDGALTCNKTVQISVINTNWCTVRNFTLSSPATSTLELNYSALPTAIATTCTVQLYTNLGVPSGVPIVLAGTSTVFPGVYTPGDIYYAIVTSTQSSKSTTCTTSLVQVSA